jgi:hypothetical protein
VPTTFPREVRGGLNGSSQHFMIFASGRKDGVVVDGADGVVAGGGR